MLRNQIAVVTGASSGLGRASALLLAQEGAKVCLVARRMEKLQECVHEIESLGSEALPIEADVANEDDVKNLYEQLKQKWGDKIDILVANAGTNGTWAPIEELSVEEWDKTLNTNLRGTFLTVKFAVPLMKERGGSIIVMSSINGTRTFNTPGASAYATSKAGQVALTKMLAVELGKFKIRVNAICPGSIESEIHDKTEHRHSEAAQPLPVERPKGEIPLTQGRVPDASTVGNLVTFLASDRAAHITGSEMWIDGGQSLFR
eukprot:GILK01005997.1.p1 GENE.GILK01005997.1~~GILK01005997.1.p1  ORF type:complete len:261 (+),score=47.39 GILK01005997.1:153-935(+)